MILTKLLRYKGDRSFHLRTTYQDNEYNVIARQPKLGSIRAKIQLVTYKKGKEVCAFVRTGEIISILTKQAITFIKGN